MRKAFEPRRSRRSRKESGWEPELGPEENEGNDGRKQGAGEIKVGVTLRRKDLHTEKTSERMRKAFEPLKTLKSRNEFGRKARLGTEACQERKQGQAKSDSGSCDGAKIIAQEKTSERMRKAFEPLKTLKSRNESGRKGRLERKHAKSGSRGRRNQIRAHAKVQRSSRGEDIGTNSKGI